MTRSIIFLVSFRLQQNKSNLVDRFLITLTGLFVITSCECLLTINFSLHNMLLISFFLILSGSNTLTDGARSQLKFIKAEKKLFLVSHISVMLTMALFFFPQE